MIEIRIEHDALDQALARLLAGMRDTTPLMRALAATLLDQTEENFARQGRPAWLPLRPNPRRQGGRILQDTGRLAASITSDYSSGHAQVGSNVVYAAIHQFGGQTRPHPIAPKRAKALAFGGRVVKRVNHPGSAIPARPYLPITADGQLQPEAEAAVNEDVQHYLRSLIGG